MTATNEDVLHATHRAILCVLDAMPDGQRRKAREYLELMAAHEEREGEFIASYFCRLLSNQKAG